MKSEKVVIFFTFGVGIRFQSAKKPESESGVRFVFFSVVDWELESNRFKGRSGSRELGSKSSGSRRRISSEVGVRVGLKLKYDSATLN